MTAPAPRPTPTSTPPTVPPTASSTIPQPAALPTAVSAAWQGALAAEHAAVFGYAVAGPLLPAAQMGLARTDEAAHRTLRDTTAAVLTARGLTPVSSLGNYPLPFAVRSAPAARQLALRLEDACAAAWRYLLAVAATPPGGPVAVRTAAQTALTASAIRAVHWRELITPAAPTTAFPGI